MFSDWNKKLIYHRMPNIYNKKKFEKTSINEIILRMLQSKVQIIKCLLKI